MKLAVPVLLVVLAYVFMGPMVGTWVMLAVILYSVYNSLPSLYVLLAQRHYPDNLDKTFALFKRAYKTGRMSTEHRIYYAYISIREGRLQKAEEILNAVLAFKQPPDVKMRAKSNQAILLWQQDRLDDALEVLYEVFEQYKTTSIYGTLGYLLIEKGDMDRALEFNLEAHEYNDSNDVIMDNLGQIYNRIGDFQKAGEIYERMWELKKPDFPVPFYNYAVTRLNLDDRQGAAELLKEGLDKRFTHLATVSREQMEQMLEGI